MSRPNYARALLAVILTASCSSSTDSSPTPPSTGSSGTVAVVTITPPGLALQVGRVGTLTARAISETGATLTGKAVAWSSSSTSIATVSAGTVTGAGVGTALITATIEGKSAAVSVTVSASPSTQATFASIAAGGAHTCALNAAGKAYCWGWNLHGELGNGTQNPTHNPVAVSGNLTFTKLSAGGNHTCGIASTGATYCWGFNPNGQLGDGTKADRLTPTLVSGGVSFAAVNAGGVHTCGLNTAGVAFCWGAASSIGDGSSVERVTPVAVSGGLTFVSIGAGSTHTCAMTAAGKAYCWGQNGSGILGDGTSEPVRLVPTAVAGNAVFKSVVTGWNGGCGLVNDNTTYCWGFLVPPGATAARVPTLVAAGVPFVTLGIGPTASHGCALTAFGVAYCWGTNSNGQVGDGGATGTRSTPVAVAGGLAFASVMGGGTHTCGLTTTGAAYCWGNNSDGQLGDGGNFPHFAPVAVVAP